MYKNALCYFEQLGGTVVIKNAHTKQLVWQFCHKDIQAIFACNSSLYIVSQNQLCCWNQHLKWQYPVKQVSYIAEFEFNLKVYTFVQQMDGCHILLDGELYQLVAAVMTKDFVSKADIQKNKFTGSLLFELREKIISDMTDVGAIGSSGLCILGTEIIE